MKAVNSDALILWEFSLQKVVNQKKAVDVEEKKAKFEKLGKQIIDFAEYYRPYILKQFFEGHMKCRIPRKGREIKIKKCAIPAFRVFTKEAWGLGCIVLKNGNLKLSINRKIIEITSSSEANRQFLQVFNALFEKLNAMRKQKVLTDFSFVCLTESGEEVKRFFAHQAVLLSSGSNQQEMPITIRSPGDLNVVENVVKWLYFQPIRHFESLKEIEQFSELMIPFNSDKQRFEILVMDYYINKMQQALENNQSEECDLLLMESKELAEKYHYQLLASFSDWSATYSLWKLRFVDLYKGSWTHELRKTIEEESGDLHELLKVAKYEKDLELLVQFAQDHLPKLIKSFSHGKENVAFPLGEKKVRIPIFIHLAEEMWNVQCVFDEKFNEFCLTSKEERIPYPLYLMDREAPMGGLQKSMRYVHLIYALHFEEEQLKYANLHVQMMHHCLYMSALDQQAEVIMQRLEGIAKLAEQYTLPLLSQAVEWWRSKSHFWKSLKNHKFCTSF